MRNLIKSAWELIRQNRKPYIVLNALYYLLVVVCMIYIAFNQPLQQLLLEQVGMVFTTGPLSFVGQSYINAKIFTAISSTFLVNLLIGSFGSITLPSLLIPFSGLLVGIYRAVMWGLLLSPAHPDLRLVMIPHSLTLLVEGQAYILTMLAAYLQGRAFLWPKSVGVETHLKGYWEGLKQTGKIYVLVVLTLAIAAVYEVIEAVIMITSFS
ncbi:MAG TPA: hypothetical protein VK249_07980 [Anaerolineales bacterium]|nr:hypothetical protein [Anaerolineales bacterium]